MYKLYWSPGSAAMAPMAILNAINVPHELIKLDDEKREQKSADYMRLNPHGRVPTLIYDGEKVMYEAAAICLYLADKHPECGLVPALRTPARAHCYKWLIWCTNTLQAMLMHYFYPERMVDDGDHAARTQVQRHAEARIGPMLDGLDAQVGSHDGDWLLASGYSVADAYAFMLCRWTRGFPRPARSLPHLGPYLARMLARPAVQRTLAAEELPPPFV